MKTVEGLKHPPIYTFRGTIRKIIIFYWMRRFNLKNGLVHCHENVSARLFWTSAPIFKRTVLYHGGPLSHVATTLQVYWTEDFQEWLEIRRDCRRNWICLFFRWTDCGWTRLTWTSAQLVLMSCQKSVFWHIWKTDASWHAGPERTATAA